MKDELKIHEVKLHALIECNNCNISAHTYIGSFIRFMNRLIEKKGDVMNVT